MNFSKVKDFSIMVLLSAALSALTLVFAAPVMRVARSYGGAIYYWSTFPLLSVVVWQMGEPSTAIGILALTSLVGVYFELEKKTRNMFISGAVSIVIAALITATATQQWLSSKGETFETKVKGQIQLFVTEAQTKLGPEVKLSADALVAQLPSALVGLLIITLALSLIFEGPIRSLFKVGFNDMVHQNLRAFKLPDGLIWIAMISFLFSFLELKNEALMMASTNVLNVMVVLYFFQGLAILDALFLTLRFGSFLRMAIYVFALIQLFILVAAVGFVDYWVNFRNRFLKMRQPTV